MWTPTINFILFVLPVFNSTEIQLCLVWKQQSTRFLQEIKRKILIQNMKIKCRLKSLIYKHAEVFFRNIFQACFYLFYLPATYHGQITQCPTLTHIKDNNPSIHWWWCQPFQQEARFLQFCLWWGWWLKEKKNRKSDLKNWCAFIQRVEAELSKICWKTRHFCMCILLWHKYSKKWSSWTFHTLYGIL